MSKRILIVGTPSARQETMLSVLMENGAEVVFQGKQAELLLGSEHDVLVWEDCSPRAKETEKDTRPYYRKFEKRGKW